MKKQLFILPFLSILFLPVFAAQERITTSTHDVIKVTLD
jgi:hypothetical protein